MDCRAARHCARRAPRGRRPRVDRVATTTRRHPLPVGGEGDREEPPTAADQAQVLARRHVPHARGSCARPAAAPWPHPAPPIGGWYWSHGARCEQRAVWRDLDAVHEEELRGRHERTRLLDEPHLVVGAPRREVRAARVLVARAHVAPVSSEHRHHLARVDASEVGPVRGHPSRTQRRRRCTKLSILPTPSVAWLARGAACRQHVSELFYAEKCTRGLASH